MKNILFNKLLSHLGAHDIPHVSVRESRLVRKFQEYFEEPNIGEDVNTYKDEDAGLDGMTARLGTLQADIDKALDTGDENREKVLLGTLRAIKERKVHLETGVERYKNLANIHRGYADQLENEGGDIYQKQLAVWKGLKNKVDPLEEAIESQENIIKETVGDKVNYKLEEKLVDKQEELTDVDEDITDLSEKIAKQEASIKETEKDLIADDLAFIFGPTVPRMKDKLQKMKAELKALLAKKKMIKGEVADQQAVVDEDTSVDGIAALKVELVRKKHELASLQESIENADPGEDECKEHYRNQAAGWELRAENHIVKLEALQIALDGITVTPTTSAVGTAKKQLEALREKVGDGSGGLKAKYAATAEGVDANAKDLDPENLKLVDFKQLVEKFRPSPDTLSFTTPDLLMKMVHLFKEDLHLPDDSVDWMGFELSKAFRQDVLAMDETPLKKAIRNPRIGLDGNGERDLALLRAWDPGYALAMKLFMVNRDAIKDVLKYKGDIQKKSSERGETLLTKPMEIVSQGFDALTEGLSSGDPEKIAMGALFAIGAGYLLKSLFGSDGKEAKPGDGIGFGKLLLMGSGILAGGYVFAPDIMKQLTGGGVNADIAGVDRLEDLISLSKESPEAYNQGLDAGVTMAVANVNVREIFGSITQDSSAMKLGTYDGRSTTHEMIQLNRGGGLRRAFGSIMPELLSVGPVYLDKKPYKQLGWKQKAYVDASKKLYKNAIILKNLYDERIYPETNVTFEDAFLDANSNDYRGGVTMETLYYLLTDKYRGSDEGGLLSTAAVDLAKSELDDKFREHGILIDKKPTKDGKVVGTMYGYPIVIKVKKGKAAGEPNIYTFFLVGSNKEITTFTNATEDATDAGAAMKNAVKARILELMKDVTIEGAPGEGAEPTYNTETGKWEVKDFEINGYADIGAAAFKTTVSVEPYSDGTALKVLTEGVDDRVIVIDSNVDLPTNTILASIFGNASAAKELWFLRYFYQDRAVGVKYKGTGNQFQLKVGGKALDVTCTTTLKKGKPVYSYSVPNVSQIEAILQDSNFIQSYIDSRVLEKDFKIFDRVKDYVNLNLKEKYASHFGVGLWRSIKKLEWPDGDDVISGGVPDNYLNVLIDSRRTMAIESMKGKMRRAKTAAGIEKADNEMRMQIAELETFYNGRLQVPSPDGEDWGRDEVVIAIVDPLRNIGTRSDSYAGSLRGFEANIIAPLHINDVSDDIRIAATKFMNVFLFYTAHLDVAKLDTLVKVSDGAGGTFQGVSKETNMAENYCEYVSKQIGVIAGRTSDPSEIGSPPWTGGRGRGEGIKTYEQWRADSLLMNNKPLNGKDALAPMTEAEILDSLVKKATSILNSYSTSKNDEYKISAPRIKTYFLKNWQANGTMTNLAKFILKNQKRRSGQLREIDRAAIGFDSAFKKTHVKRLNNDAETGEFYERWWKRVKLMIIG